MSVQDALLEQYTEAAIIEAATQARLATDEQIGVVLTRIVHYCG